jgi:photosystem II stability/assembly factor-like uncharacterized protein
MSGDAGKTWRIVPVPEKYEFNFENISVVDMKNWWIGAAAQDGTHRIVWTTDGAETEDHWNTYKPEGAVWALQALKDKKNVWAGGFPKIINSPDYGKTWEDKTDGVSGGIRGLFFVDGGVGDGWAVGGGIFRNSGEGGKWKEVKASDKLKGELLKIVVLPDPKQKVLLGPSGASNAGSAGITYISFAGSGIPDGNINPETVVIQIATNCNQGASAITYASSVVSGDGDSKLVSFMLPAGLDPGQYFISISDHADGDANYESLNCFVIEVVE